MDWVPIVFGIFKIGVLGIAMFFAIKWHRDKDKEEEQRKKEEAKQADCKHTSYPK